MYQTGKLAAYREILLKSSGCEALPADGPLTASAPDAAWCVLLFFFDDDKLFFG